MTILRILIRALAVFGFLSPTATWAQSYSPAKTPMESTGFKHLSNKGKLKTASDLSGIACLTPDTAGKRVCLVISDEETFAQLATLDGDKLIGGDVIPLIDNDRQNTIGGKRPKKLNCSGGTDEPDFKDLDGEGVAYVKPYFYIVGSHGCSRKKNKIRYSSMILVRVHVDDKGKPIGNNSSAVEATYRLNDILRSNPTVGSYYGQDLEQKKDSRGLNVEGIAAINNKLYIGLRAPSVNNMAYIIETEIDYVFGDDKDPSKAHQKTLALKLGDNVGIRDLAPMDGERLLVLTGRSAASAKGVASSLYSINLNSCKEQDVPNSRICDTNKLFDIEENPQIKEEDRPKAEAAWPLGGVNDKILVLFDGPENGGARIYERK
ncbi:DUF3616 domain-containing protein [Methylobacterium radiotolerans]|uniref:DUF3616 domain-containing protein n=1 Tax=Methylobacterium radiotolerans TaxID=31998 RepID=UPI0009FB04C5|nr:DUF3616 domain-containing protein [Methylobacterium radiotolerans]